VRFSLIVSTLGRTAELADLLMSLESQSFRDFEVLVVDQNEDDRLLPIIEKFRASLNIRHLHSERGVSRGRNVGIDNAYGEILGFPDDDCLFPTDCLSFVNRIFEENPDLDGITGRSMDTQGKETIGRFAKKKGPIKKLAIWHQCIEFTIFLKCKALRELRFDPDMGIGATTPWQADEGPDLLLRLMELRKRIEYRPDVVIFHPNPVTVYDTKTFMRNYFYGCATGYLLRKHVYPLWFVLYFLMRPLGGAVLYLILGQSDKARYYLKRAMGRLHGWRVSK